ncbi:hypothetical protein ACFLMW_003756 [Salmonella enterica]
MSKLKTYHAHIATLVANGSPLVSFSCPDCQEVIQAMAAPKGETWDTFATCPHCDELYYRIITHDSVKTSRVPRVI